MNILVVFGTRPEAIKLFPVIRALREDPLFNVKVCVTAQHREMLDQVLELADIKPDYDLNLMRPNQNLSELTAAIISQVGTVIEDCGADRVIVQGDTTTAMAAAMSAFYRKIPVDHVEAGLRSGDIYAPWPEEMNRKAISLIAASHFAPTKRAADALICEGIDRSQIHITGNTVVDALLNMHGSAKAHPTIPELSSIKRELRTDQKLILVTTHRRENFDSGLQNIIVTLKELADRRDCVIVFPVHPNPYVREPVETALSGHPNIRLIPPLDYSSFVHALSSCYFVLTDSGGIQEEAPALGKPVLIVREKTERPEGVEAGTALLVGTKVGTILKEATRLLDDHEHYNRMSRAHNPFGDGKASLRIRDVLRTMALRRNIADVSELRAAS